MRDQSITRHLNRAWQYLQGLLASFTVAHLNSVRPHESAASTPDHHSARGDRAELANPAFSLIAHGGGYWAISEGVRQHGGLRRAWRTSWRALAFKRAQLTEACLYTYRSTQHFTYARIPHKKHQSRN
jgi:hypothetical protein